MEQVSVYQALGTLRSVLVVLVPVGGISTEKFVTYAQHVASCTTLNLVDAAGFNTGQQHASTHGGFEHRNWNKDIIHLRYELQHVYSEWEELFLSQKPFAVVGIADCSVENDLATTVNSFTALAARYRISPSTSIMQQGVFPKTCLAFEMRRDQKDPDLSNFKVIPDQDFSHFNFYVTNIFVDELMKNWLPLWEATVKQDPEQIGDRIFDSLYGGSENVSNPSTSHTALLTPLDGDWPDEAPRARKRRIVGRVRKQLGDLCLFGGSPQDALVHYRAAVEISRSCSDWEWVGSALESMAAAVLSQKDMNGASRLSGLELMEIASKLNEAKTCYNRRPRATYLEAENLLRMAIFLNEQEKRVEMAECLTRCQELVDLLDASNFEGKIKLLSAIALVYRNANFSRKYAFFVQLICRLCVGQAGVSPAKAHQLLQQVAPEYDITANALIEPTVAKNAVISRRAQLVAAGTSWTKLQASILSLMIELSQSTGNTTQAIKYLVYLMREVAPQLLKSNHAEPSSLAPNKTDWGAKLRVLSLNLPPPLDTNPQDPLRLGLGLLQRWKPLKDNAMYMHISRSVNDPLFLYRPNRKAKEAIAASANHVFVWPGHSIYFEVSLRNALASKAVLEDVRISFTPIVLTTTEVRSGDSKVEVDWLPQITMEASIQTAAQISVDAGDTVTVKLSAYIPNLCDLPANQGLASSNITTESATSPQSSTAATPMPSPLQQILRDPRCKVLLAPDCLLYTMFNCPFSEPMLRKFNTPLKQLLLNCLHFVSEVPTLSAQDSSHPWLSYSTAMRDPEPIVAVGLKSSAVDSHRHPLLQSAPDVTPGIAGVKKLQGHDSVLPPTSTSPPTKDIQHLNIATSQLRGEKLSTTLVLKNESIYTVDDFGMAIQENGETVSATTRPSQVIVGDISRLYSRISKSLPLRPGQSIELPIEFVAPNLGLVQVSFLMEYRNNASAENMWRKLRMDYSFKVVEALKPLKLEATLCKQSTLSILEQSLPHRVTVLEDEQAMDINSFAESDDEEAYFLLQVSIQNKTMVSFHLVKDDTLEDDLTAHHSAFVVDPWGTKVFSMAFHRMAFVKRMYELMGEQDGPKNYDQACVQFIQSHLKLSWRSYGNRSGSLLFDHNLIDEHVLRQMRPPRVSASLKIVDQKGILQPERPVAEWPNLSIVIKANQIYKLSVDVNHFSRHISHTSTGDSLATSSEQPPSSSNSSKTFFSAMCHAHHLSNQAHTMSWIGKNQNICVETQNASSKSSLQLPLLFHSPGMYTIATKLHDSPVSSSEDYWSRELSIIVTR